LRLKTIISVTPEPPTSDLKVRAQRAAINCRTVALLCVSFCGRAQQFCSNEKIEMIHFEVERAFSA
jgi:hypothetical protein